MCGEGMGIEHGPPGPPVATLLVHASKVKLKHAHGMKCLHVFVSFFTPAKKFHPCYFGRDEFIPG